MAKRFTCTDKWKKPFIKGLSGSYKLLWFYILDDCDTAGIWQIDFEVASIRIGENVTEKIAMEVFKDKIILLDAGEKWFIPSFIDFQYGKLQENNRAHTKAILSLKKYNLLDNHLEVKPLISPLQGAMVEVEVEGIGISTGTSIGVSTITHDLDKFSHMCMNDTIHFVAPITQQLAHLGFETELLPEYLDEFNKNLMIDGDTWKTYQDYRKHFKNWMSKKLQSSSKIPTSKNTDPNGKPIDRRLHPNFPSNYVYCDMNIYYYKNNKPDSMRKDGNFSDKQGSHT